MRITDPITALKWLMSWFGSAIHAGWGIFSDWDLAKARYIAGDQLALVAQSAIAARGDLDPWTFSMRVTSTLGLISTLAAVGIVGYHVFHPPKSIQQFFAICLMLFIGATGLLILLFRTQYFSGESSADICRSIRAVVLSLVAFFCLVCAKLVPRKADQLR
ncbi:hypothetical protein HC761_01795 [bacterium]|nr:hypothetical protein [bacterium]